MVRPVPSPARDDDEPTPDVPLAASDATETLRLLDSVVRPVLEACVPGGEPVATIRGLFRRVLGWLHSLGRLDDWRDFQAHSAGSRAIFETAVDLALLLAPTTGGRAAVDRMLAWERSAKLKLARKYAAAPPPAPSLTSARDASRRFLKEQEASIVAERQRLWGRTGHPPRWTGAGLDAAARAADAVRDRGFAEFYEREHDILCWGTHGASLALVRDQTVADVERTAAVSLGGAVEFAIIAAELAAEGAGIDEKRRREWFESLHGRVRLAGLTRRLEAIGQEHEM